MSMNNFAGYDFHLHSCYSADCDTPIEDIIRVANEKGLEAICLTDHYDMDFPDNPDGLSFELDVDGLIQKIKKLQASIYKIDAGNTNKVLNNSLQLYAGLEQGVMPSTCSKLSNYSIEHPGLDFIIASSHVVNGIDPYYPECWRYPDGTLKDVNQIYMQYFEDILYNVKHFDDYNVYGHIDYIFRYGPADAPTDVYEKVNSEVFAEKYFPRFRDILHEILKTIIENGKGIEINTGSLYRGLDYMHPHPLILSMYRELGGEILTIGSDAHDLEHIGYGFDEAVELARSIGFKYLTTFKEMKPELRLFLK